MILKNKKAFTLIEVIIVITIISILTLLGFVPYDFYSNVSKVRISKEIIDQTFNEAFLNSNSVIDKVSKKNLNIGILMEKQSHEYKILSFPFNHTGSISETVSGAKLLRTIKLEDGVNINKITVDGTESSSGVIFYFRSPDGEMDIYRNETLTGSNSEITVGYGKSIDGILSKIIKIPN
ncbi:MAG: prepilin-type N-terminal cleavage/methylation domain-containing protein [Candidatus Gracilibacteria bacterium]|nr:prepilin-type N-terminal cleavage/methylation domain-containing protein [Candidatus Gracilibacteria bacterium]